MKKLPFYIALSVAVAAIVALIASSMKRNGRSIFGGSSAPTDAASASLTWTPVNAKLNPSATLSAGSKNAANEMAALQNLLNVYNGRNVVAVTGEWDEATANQVTAIAGKGNTNLYEFAYKYLTPKVGQNAAMEYYGDLMNGKA